jgi:hypothetical protein
LHRLITHVFSKELKVIDDNIGNNLFHDCTTHCLPVWYRTATRQEHIRSKVRVATAEIEEEVRQQYRVVSTCASQNAKELLT